MISDSELSEFSTSELDRDLAGLGTLLHACVYSGAIVGFAGRLDSTPLMYKRL
ncbi:MAG: hypothetical protein V4693_07330 [Pseudomonadota bacterium]